jgi:hypothetical protein
VSNQTSSVSLTLGGNSHILNAKIVLADENLAELVRTASTAYQPNFKKFTAYTELY